VARKLVREVLVHMWCRKILPNSTRRNFSKNSNKSLPLLFKKKNNNKKKENYFTCGKPGHYARECEEAKWKPNKKTANTFETDARTTGYDNLLPTILSYCHSPDWWVDTGTNIHVCADVFLFSSYQVRRTSSLLMGNGARAAVRGVGMIDLKLTSGKIV
jgi:hypothetical protein